jgi:hypothetical protein
MKKVVRHKSLRIASALAAASSLALVLGQTVAHADPPFNNNGANTVFSGVGSNTLEDLVNAWSGEEPTPGLTDSLGNPITPTLYQAVAESTLGSRLYSFDAENPYDPFNTNPNGAGCITTKLGGNSFDRPNGSGAGATALSDALIGGKTWFEGSSKGPGGCFGTAATAQNVAGQIDFVRSSKQPGDFNATVTAPADNGTSDVATNCGPNAPKGTNTSGPCLTYIAVGHDGVSYAYWTGGGTATGATVQQISTSTLAALYNNTLGSTTTGSGATLVTYFSCLPNLSSGTVGFFLKAIGVTNTANAQASATANGCFGTEENNGNDFVTKVHAHLGANPAANTVWVTPFSIGQWVAQANMKAQDNSATARSDGVTLGDVNSVALVGGNVNNQPFTGVSPNIAADPKFESDAIWGRDLWVAAPWFKIDDPATDSVQWAGMFGTTDASFGIGTGGGAICAANATADINPFGFTTAAQVNAQRAGAANACGTQITIKNQNGNIP